MWNLTNDVAISNISYSFLKTTDVHHYATRSSTKNGFYVEHSKLEKVPNSLLRTGPKVWNALPSEFRNLSKFTFQKKLKHRLVELLAKADDYLEITQIIHEIKLTKQLCQLFCLLITLFFLLFYNQIPFSNLLA